MKRIIFLVIILFSCKLLATNIDTDIVAKKYAKKFCDLTQKNNIEYCAWILNDGTITKIHTSNEFFYCELDKKIPNNAVSHIHSHPYYISSAHPSQGDGDLINYTLRPDYRMRKAYIIDARDCSLIIYLDENAYWKTTY